MSKRRLRHLAREHVSIGLPGRAALVVRALPAAADGVVRRNSGPTSTVASHRVLGAVRSRQWSATDDAYLLIGLLRAYRLAISPLYGQVCRYHPSCSAYALEAVTVHGSVRGTLARRCAGCRAATRGPPAATTPFPPALAIGRPASSTHPTRSLSPCDFLGTIGDFIMTPLYYVISAVLVGWHELFGSWSSDPDGGVAWVLSIIGLTLVIRAALIPLFVKQIKSSRNMQLIQPKVKELQKKYGHDRERLAQETMKLYKETGTNPFASCLPILLQMPIFLALFRLLDHAAKTATAQGLPDVSDLRQSFGDAKLFGAIPISATFLSTDGLIGVQILAAVPRGRDDGDHVPDPAPADEQEHAGRRADRAVRPAAEDAALRPPGRLRRRWHRVPDRRALLLDHLEPVDDGPAVLRDPQQPGPRDPGRRGQGGARPGEGRSARARDGTAQVDGGAASPPSAEQPAPARQQRRRRQQPTAAVQDSQRGKKRADPGRAHDDDSARERDLSESDETT